MRPLTSASGLPRALQCDASLVLPRTPRGDVQDMADAKRGDVVHAYLHALANGVARAEALERVPEDDPARRFCEAIEVEHVPRGGLLEVAFAWDPAAGKARILGENIGRDYEGHGLRVGEEFPGTADTAGLLVLEGERVALVGDWKGYSAEPARESWQLRFLAMCAASVWDCDSALVWHGNYTDVTFDRHRLDAIDLAEARSRIRNHWRLLKDLDTPGVAVQVRPPNPGRWCRYCECYSACDAKVGLARQMAGGLEGVVPEALTPETAARLIPLLEQYDEIRDRVWRQLEALARETPIHLADGRVMRMAPGRKSESVANAPAVLGLLGELLGRDYAAMASQTTKGLIEDAARAWAKDNGRPIGKAVAQVLDEARRLQLLETRAGETKVRLVKGDR